jgi:hypothetical protein
MRKVGTITDGVRGGFEERVKEIVAVALTACFQSDIILLHSLETQ